ncbi:MAG: alpha/beta hydrolase [Spirochaetales bacterium]|nr:alpha/beta hydrolase [Spirochaetales bacterium]
MTVVYIILGIVALLFIVSFALALFFAKMVTKPHCHTYDSARKQVLDHCSIDPYKILEEHEVKDFSYPSPRGYSLKGRIISPDPSLSFPDGRKRAVILCHSWTGNHITMLTYGKLYLDLGFYLVAYDHRYHGENEKRKGTHCTMGLYESLDLQGLYEFVRDLFPQDTVWGLQGESMGSATVMQAAPEMKGISFIVEDCGFSSMRGQMAATLDNTHLPHFPILNLGSLILKTAYQLDMSKVNAAKAVENIDVPMLFCQGDNDTFVPTRMIYDVYNAKKDKKRMQLFKGSKHAESIWDHTEQYAKVLKEFLQDYGII